MIEKVKLTRVHISNKAKDGTPYVVKQGKNTGKPYSKAAIKCDKYGDKWLSGFVWDSYDTIHKWQTGDEVSIVVSENGQYLNFEKPKAKDFDDEERLVLINRVRDLEAAFMKHIAECKKEAPETPEEGPDEIVIDDEDVHPDDLPF